MNDKVLIWALQMSAKISFLLGDLVQREKKVGTTHVQGKVRVGVREKGERERREKREMYEGTKRHHSQSRPRLQIEGKACCEAIPPIQFSWQQNIRYSRDGSSRSEVEEANSKRKVFPKHALHCRLVVLHKQEENTQPGWNYKWRLDRALQPGEHTTGYAGTSKQQAVACKRLEHKLNEHR